MQAKLYRVSVGLRDRDGKTLTLSQRTSITDAFAAIVKDGSYATGGGVWKGAQEGALHFESAGGTATRDTMGLFGRHAARIANAESVALVVVPCDLDFLAPGEVL